MKRLFLLAVVILCSLTTYAQRTKEIVASSYQDVSFGAGLYMNNQDNSLQHGTIYSLDYAQFGYYNVGFRGGLTYIDQVGRDVSFVGAPIHIAWRSGIDKRTMQQKLESSAYSFVTGDGDVTSALLNLTPMRLEVNGGITPMVATQRGGITYGWSSYRGDYAEELSVKNGFALSADIGARLSIRVWRFNLFFEPQYHYWLTDNFKYQIKTENGIESTNLKRSYFSFLLGLNFILWKL